MNKRRVERDSLRERERHARAQMSSQGNEIQEGVPMFRPPVKVSPAATDHVTQQIQSRFGDYHTVKHFLDDPKSSIGVYSEPASPAPGGPLRGGEFKKPHHTSSQNGRLHQRMPHFPKCPEGLPVGLPKRGPTARLYNGRVQQTVPTDLDDVQTIFNEMKSLSVVQPLSAIAQTPHKEMESKFIFNPVTPIKPIENVTQSNFEVKQNVQTKTHLDRHSNRRSSVELERDLRLTDSEDEPRKRMHSMTASPPAGASSSDSGSTDSDTDSSSDDSKPNGAVLPEASPAHDSEETPEVVEGPGETAAVPPVNQRGSWSLRNFAPQPIGAPTQVQSSSPRSNNSHSSPVRNNKNSPRSNRTSPNRGVKSSPRINNRLSPRINRSSPRRPKSPRGNRLGDSKISNISSTAPGSNTSTSSNTSGNNIESDSCSDSKEVDSKEVEIVLAQTKEKARELLSDFSDSDCSEGDVRRSVHSDILGSSFDRSIGPNKANRIGSRRSPRTPARPRPPSSPSASEDEAPRPPRPDPEKRKARGRPRKNRTEEDAVKKRRGRPPKHKLTPTIPVRPPPPPSSSDEESSHSSPPIPTHSDSDPECRTVASTVDKKKKDTLRNIFCSNNSAKGGGKGGAKGGKGKGQVMIIEANSEHYKDDDLNQRRLKEEELQRKLKEEEIHRKMKEEALLQRKREEEQHRKRQEELALKRIREEDLIRKRNEETSQRRLKEEALQKRLKEEEIRRKLDEDKRREEERRKDEEERKRLKEEETLKRRREELLEESLQTRRLHEDDVQKRFKSEESSHRKVREDDISHRRYAADHVLQRKVKESDYSPRVPKDDDVLQKRIREDEANQRRPKMDASADYVAGRPQMMVRIDLWKLEPDLADRLVRLEHSRKRPPPPPPAPPDNKSKTAKQNPEVTPTNHERAESVDLSRNCMQQPLAYYSYLEKGYPDCSSDEESRDHKFYLSEAMRLRQQAEKETDPIGRIMLYQESVLCFVLTGRVLELELDTKKAFTMYRETLEYIKSLNAMPARCRASPYSTTFTKLDILSYRCQALLCLRMFKMYKREVKEYNKILQDYQNQKQSGCLDAVNPVGTVSPLSPTPSPAGSIGSVGSAGSSSSGYGSGSSGAPAATPHHTPGPTPTPAASVITMPLAAHNASILLVKYYTFLHMGHDLWDQADSLIRENNWTELFVSVDKVCGPLTMHSTFRHLVKYVRYALSVLKTQGNRHST